MRLYADALRLSQKCHWSISDEFTAGEKEHYKTQTSCFIRIESFRFPWDKEKCNRYGCVEFAIVSSSNCNYTRTCTNRFHASTQYRSIPFGEFPITKLMFRTLNMHWVFEFSPMLPAFAESFYGLHNCLFLLIFFFISPLIHSLLFASFSVSSNALDAVWLISGEKKKQKTSLEKVCKYNWSVANVVFLSFFRLNVRRGFFFSRKQHQPVRFIPLQSDECDDACIEKKFTNGKKVQSVLNWWVIGMEIAQKKTEENYAMATFIRSPATHAHTQYCLTANTSKIEMCCAAWETIMPFYAHLYRAFGSQHT